MTKSGETRASKYALAFIFVTMLVDTIGLGIIIPVTPALIRELTGRGMSDAAWWGGWLMFVFALMQFLCAPIMGNLSDRFGRRPVLILSLVALAIDYTITGLAPTIAWLFIGRFLSGIAGATFPTVNAYIADVSPPEKRAANFGLTGAAFGIGFILGPLIGGLIGSQFGPRMPFFVSAGIAIANAIYGWFVLHESLTKENRRKFEMWRSTPWGSLRAVKRYPQVFGLIGVIVLMRLSHDANPSVWTYFSMEKFHWTPADVGYSLMVMGAAIALVYGVLTRTVIPRIGETNAIYFGIFCSALGFAGYAFSTAGWMLYGWMLVWALSGLAGPALNSFMSRHMPANEQGELQGALSSIGSLTSIVAPLLLTNLFSYFTGPAAPIYFPGAAFLAASVFSLCAMLVFARAKAVAVQQPAE